MLVLKSIGLVVLFAVISYLVAEIAISAVLVTWVYPYALTFVAVYLEHKGRGYYAEPNREAQGFNILIRTVASSLLYLLGLVLMLIFIPPMRAIKAGCLLGWLASGFLTVFYEFCMVPQIGRFDHLKKDAETDEDVAVFQELDGAEFELGLGYWSLEEYPTKDRRYAVMQMSNYWAFCPLWQE